MSILSITFPISIAGIAIGAVRPLIGVSLFASLLLLFKPLLKGLLQAGLLLLSPRKSLDERRMMEQARSARMLNNIAREYDTSQPNLAAELRQFASRA